MLVFCITNPVVIVSFDQAAHGDGFALAGVVHNDGIAYFDVLTLVFKFGKGLFRFR
jgi:hypothetical protein